MNEASLLAYRVRKAGRNVRFGKFKPSFGDGAKVFPPESKENKFGTDSFSILPMRCSSEALVASSSFPPKNLLSSRKKANATPEDSAVTSEVQRWQPPGGNA